MGGGLELAACADVRVAEEQIKIALPETGLGVVPGWSGTQRTVRRFGAQAVRRLALLGEVFSAQDALDVGVVDYLVPAGKALEISFELAERASQRAPRATEIAKLMIGIAEGEEGRNAVDSLASVAVFGTDELAEGVGAFREKRKPDF
jgi:enoyl-CoA hydratase/carnithine racemase